MFTILSNTLQYFLSLNIDTHKLLFEDVRVKDRLKQIEFMDIPFIIMGKKKLDCTHGVHRNRSLKKKRLDEKVYIYIKRLKHIYMFYASDTSLSKYISEMKDKHNETPILKWSIVKSVPTYSNISKKCALCLQENYEKLSSTMRTRVNYSIKDWRCSQNVVMPTNFF